MTLTRRSFLQTTAAAGTTAALLPRSGWAARSLTLGEMEILSLSDGHLVQPADFILDGTDRSVADPIIAKYGVGPDQFEPPCNVTLLRHGDRLVLFDAGSGTGFLPTVGTLPDALDEIGVAPEDVTDVIFTHGHADHLWGVVDDFDELYFYEAQHRMGKREFDYWNDPATLNSIRTSRQSMASGAKRRLDLVGDTFATFEDGQEILPGIMARMTAGHSPGHMSFQIGTGSDAVMVIGDAVTNHHFNFERPDLLSGPDQDPEMGARTRVNLLDQLAHEQMRIVGFHLPEGGLGRVEKQGSGYRYVAGA
ncbi:MAG: MBL fold metallo-hydrolase [Marinibacterium sp.]